MKASVIICFTSSGRAAKYVFVLLSTECACHSVNIWDYVKKSKQLVNLLLYVFYPPLICAFNCRLIAKYRPTMPVVSVVIPRLRTNQLKWSFSGAFEVLPQVELFTGYVKLMSQHSILYLLFLFVI